MDFEVQSLSPVTTTYAAPASAPASLLERATLARTTISDRAQTRRAVALAELAAFSEAFGAGGFVIANVGEWFTVAAPELEDLALRCRVPFRLQGGTAIDDPATIILGSAKVTDLAELGEIVSALITLAVLREGLHKPQAIEVTQTAVWLAHDGQRYTVGPEGLLATGADKVARPVPAMVAA